MVKLRVIKIDHPNPPKEELKCADMLDVLFARYTKRREVFATMMKWSVVAPFDYALKQCSGTWIHWLQPMLHQRVDTILLHLQNPLFAIPICSSLERCTLNLYWHVNLVGQMLSAAALKQHLGHLRMLNLSAQSSSSTGYSPGSSPTHHSLTIYRLKNDREGVFVG